METEQRW